MNTLITTRKFLPLVQHLRSHKFSRSAVLMTTERPSAFFKRLKANQKKFQKDDGLPIYLKGGTMDKILYQTSLLGTIIGVGLSFYFIGITAYNY